MKNLEIKVKVDSLKDVLSAMEFALEKGTLNQKDTYFLIGDKRLKLREEKIGDELIYYVRKNQKKSKESRYFVLPIYHRFVPLVKRVLIFIFGEKVVVSKKRKLFLYKDTRIHLDEVVGLGEFLELETVINNHFNDQYFVDQHEEVKSKLGLIKYELLPNSYSDLVLFKK